VSRCADGEWTELGVASGARVEIEVAALNRAWKGRYLAKVVMNRRVERHGRASENQALDDEMQRVTKFPAKRLQVTHMAGPRCLCHVRRNPDVGGAHWLVPIPQFIRLRGTVVPILHDSSFGTFSPKDPHSAPPLRCANQVDGKCAGC
jgi:hypothetical protein